MGILDKFKPQPRWKHADPAIRLEAVRSLEDAAEMGLLAESDPDAKVRRAATARLADPAVLGRIADSDTDVHVRDEAADVLMALAHDGTAAALALDAVGHITDGRRLATLAKLAATESTDAVREAALARLSEDRAIGGVARHAKVEAIAASAAARVTATDELVDITLNSDHREIALTTFDRVIDVSAPDVALLRSIESRAQHKAVAKRARALLQAIEEAEAARRAAEEERLRQEGLLCDAAEGLTTVTDPGRSEADVLRLSAAWGALVGASVDASRRFRAAVEMAQSRIAARRQEIEEAAERARVRGEALASREALCQRVETIEGDDILEQLAPIEEDWASLTPLVGNGPEADRLADRFVLAVAACRKRHALGAALKETRASLDALVLEAEALTAEDDAAAAATRWQAISRDARGLMSTLADASRPAADLADRLAAVSQAFVARETAARDAVVKARQDVATRLLRLAERAKRTVEAESATLREGERVMRDIGTALDETSSGDSSKEISEAIGVLRKQQEAVAPRVKELRDMDEWRRFANAQQQEQLIAMAEAIVASLKADEDAGKTTELAATARALREFHTRWQDVADAPRHSAQRLWDRFKAATDFIRSRCEVYFAKVREERGSNLARKVAVVEESEALANSTDWAKTAARFQELQNEWQEIGPVTRDAARDLAQRFRTACNAFFTRRRDDLTTRKKVWTDNLAKKEAMCVRAEDLAESMEWEAASSEFKRMQAEWKTVGPVRRNKSETIWNRFRTSADRFFERYHNRHQIALASKIAEHEALVVGLENFAALDEAPENLAAEVQTLRTTIAKSAPIPGAELKALNERWTLALARLAERFPDAFKGTDLDPAAIRQRMEKLIAKVEQLVAEDKPASTRGKSATELLAERLRSALASNAMGGRSSDDTKWRAAAETVKDAQASWQRLAPIPGEEATALEERFGAACRRVLDQVKLHISPVSGPTGGRPEGGFGGFGGSQRSPRPGGGGRPGGARAGSGPRDGGSRPRAAARPSNEREAVGA